MKTTIRMPVAFLALSVVASTTVASDSRHMEGEHLDMNGFRVFWNPEAGYSGHGGMALSYVKIPQGTTRTPENLTLSTRFGRPLPPGDYRVWIRYHDPVPKAKLSVGGTDVEFSLAKGLRYAIVPISIPEPASDFSLQVLECGIRVIIDWIFITNDPHWQVTSDNRGQRLAPRPAEPEVPSERDGNWIANASFEAGQPVDLRAPYQHNLALYSNMADAQHKVHGRHSLKVTIVDLPWRDHFFSGSEIVYGPVWLREAQQYRFSVQLRSDLPAKAIVHVNSKELGSAGQASIQPSSEWQQLGLDVGPVKKPGLYTVSVRFEADRPGNVWIDNLFFGKGQQFSPREPVEAGPTWPRPGNVMRPGEQDAKIAVWREPSATNPSRFEYRVYDWNDQIVADGQIDLSDAPNGYCERTLPLPADTTGVYRMHYRTVLSNAPDVWRQASFCVLPEHREDCPGPIGVYGSFAPQALSIYSLAGFCSTNTLSPAGHIATWNRVEPVFGEGYTFRDADVDRAREHGIHIMCNINTQRDTVFPKGLPIRPGSARDTEIGHHQGAFPVSAWKSFVGALSKHYQGRIRDYLIVDEPAYQYTPEEYFKLLKASSEAIKAADSANRVWMHTHTVVKPEYLRVLDQLDAHLYCDGLYDYVRTRDRGELLREWSHRRNRPVWAVEYGGFATFYVDPSVSVEDLPVSLAARDNVVWSLESAIRSFGWALAERYYRYDARFTGHDNYMTMFEADGTLKPAGVALALLNAKLAGLRPRGEIEVPDPIQAFLFSSEDRSLLAIRHADKGAANIEISLEPAVIEITDCLGKPISPIVKDGKVQLVVDRQFRYMTFAASKLDSVLSAISAARNKPAVNVRSNLLRQSQQPLVLRIELTNQTGEEFVGFVCPESKSLYHFAGYVPIRQQKHELRSRLMRRLRLAAGESTAVEYRLNYDHDWHFDKQFPGALIEFNLEGSSISQILKLDLEPTN
ncbi:MAG: hypothetical protein H8E44_18740 [Planctomycetes bacterium]|nr:hypothetical protein [Planctomycetota bacterium]MBL7043939.1 hypothetical protein [Pirellulaceae bacterium]